MKIVFIGNTAWSMYNFRRYIFEYLINMKNDIVVLAPYTSEHYTLLQKIGCQCYPIDIEAKGNNPIMVPISPHK